MLIFSTLFYYYHLRIRTNKIHTRIQPADNPHEFIEGSGLHQQQVGAWLAGSRRRIIATIFF